MKAKKRLEVVWETHEITKISFNQHRRAKAFCQSCESDAPHLSIAEAAALLQTTDREIFRLTEAGEIHYLETETGALLVCRNSLSTENKNFRKGELK